MIVGNSLSRRIIPFGIVFTLEENSDTYYKLIKAFGNIMGKMPRVIVTDQTPAAKKAIDELKRENEFDSFHILDIHHILSNLRKKLKDKSDIKLYASLAACTNQK